MSKSVITPAIDYPCSDGQPMGESDLHIVCMSYVLQALRRHFEKCIREDVYVSANSFLYYEQGNRRAVVAPDVFVVRGVPGFLRDSYLLWKEPKGPDFVLEVTSASTRREDGGRKRKVYAMLGVEEYFLYDPRGEYLTPPLQGFQLQAGEYRPLPAVPTLPGGGGDGAKPGARPRPPGPARGAHAPAPRPGGRAGSPDLPGSRSAQCGAGSPRPGVGESTGVTRRASAPGVHDHSVDLPNVAVGGETAWHGRRCLSLRRTPPALHVPQPRPQLGQVRLGHLAGNGFLFGPGLRRLPGSSLPPRPGLRHRLVIRARVVHHDGRRHGLAHRQAPRQEMGRRQASRTKVPRPWIRPIRSPRRNGVAASRAPALAAVHRRAGPHRPEWAFIPPVAGIRRDRYGSIAASRGWQMMSMVSRSPTVTRAPVTASRARR